MLVPKKPDGFCLSTTMSCGAGAIGLTISLPSRLVTMVWRSSSLREFFQAHDPVSQLSSRLRPVAAERPVDVDDQQRRPLAEAAAGAVARRVEHRAIALGEKFVPDRFRHCSFPSIKPYAIDRARRPTVPPAHS